MTAPSLHPGDRSVASQLREFFRYVETRIAHETALATSEGIRPTARNAAACRASDLTADLLYFRAMYAGENVLVGVVDGR